METSKTKKYILASLLQVLLVALFAVYVFFAFKLEAFVLNPLLYMLPLGALFVGTDIVALLLIFKPKKSKDDAGKADRKKHWIRTLIVVGISATLMIATTVTVYAAIARPAFYAQFMTLGNKYLSEGRYEEAILEFEKAIKVEGKSVEARIGLAKGSVEIGDIDRAVEVLGEAQQLDFDNEDLLIEIVYILKDADPNAAYKFLMNYVDEYGERNLDPRIRELLDSSKEFPQIPYVMPPSGTYINPFLLKLESDKVRVGHVFYYTLDGSEPDEDDEQYRGGIDIESDSYIRFRGYNPAGEYTEVFEVYYTIDTTVAPKIRSLIDSAKAEMDATEVGKTEAETQVGQCIPGAKEELQTVLDSGETLLVRNAVSLEEGNWMVYTIENAIEAFRNKIVVPTDRTALESEIARAEEVVKTGTEGTAVGQYRSGAKATLNSDIEKAKAVLNNVIARQTDIDQATEDIQRAITRYEGKKITELDKTIERTGAKVGPVTVSLLWSSTDDLDLHVISPIGDEIYFGNRNGRSGGKLDVDRQVSSFVANPVENIYWQNPPHGTYTVKVHIYSKRSSGNVPFKVRVMVDGESKIYNMSLYSGTTTVCTFTY